MRKTASVGIGKLFCRLKDLAVLLVLLVEEMDIACGNNRLTKLASNVQNTAVVILQNRFIADNAVINEKTVIADGLNFEVIVKRSYALELSVRRTVHHCAVKLAHSAG